MKPQQQSRASLLSCQRKSLTKHKGKAVNTLAQYSVGKNTLTLSMIESSYSEA